MMHLGLNQDETVDDDSGDVRAGWAEAAREIAQAGDDALVIGEFGNAADSELSW